MEAIDVPSKIDLRLPDDAKEWARTAILKKPVRPEFFACFESVLFGGSTKPARVLELGSGPGFLAEYLLSHQSTFQMVLLDFSKAMHELARHRLTLFRDRAEFVERDFKNPVWPEGLQKFDAIVTLQAVHELRHKRHASAFHRQVHELLLPGGCYVVCDHHLGLDGMKNDQLYMTVEEQIEAIKLGGWKNVRCALKKGGMALHVAA